MKLASSFICKQENNGIVSIQVIQVIVLKAINDSTLLFKAYKRNRLNREFGKSYSMIDLTILNESQNWICFTLV